MNNYINYISSTQQIAISSDTACDWFCVVNGNIRLDKYNGSFKEQNGGYITLNPSLPQYEDEGFGTIVCYFNNGTCQVKRSVDVKIKTTIFYATKNFINFKGKNSYANLELLLTNSSASFTNLSMEIIPSNFTKKPIISQNITLSGTTCTYNQDFDVVISPYDESLRGFHIAVISKTDNEFIGENAQQIVFRFNKQSHTIIVTQMVEDNEKDYFQISANDI